MTYLLVEVFTQIKTKSWLPLMKSILESIMRIVQVLIISMNVQDDASGHEIEEDIKQLKYKIQKMLKQHKLQIYIDVFEF